MPFTSVAPVQFSYTRRRLTPTRFATPAYIDSRTVSAGNVVDNDWRRRRSASISIGAPGIEAAGLLTSCQPGTEVTIRSTAPTGTAIAPGSCAVAVTVTSPVLSIVTVGGKNQSCEITLSATAPSVITVPACPMSVTTTVE